MKTAKWTAVAFVILVCLSASALAGETPTTTAAKNDAAETASYSVPVPLEGNLVKDLGKALQDKPGILSASVDKENARFAVTFETGKTNPDEILKALTAVNKDVKLEGVTPASPKAAKHDCGKCPSAKSCGSKKQPK
jgi:hypothetical protein